MPIADTTVTVNQPQNAVDFAAAKLAAAKVYNAGATNSHGVSVESISSSFDQTNGHRTFVQCRVRY